MSNFPQYSKSRKIENKGVNIFKNLLDDNDIPCFEVPPDSDYGLDIIAYIPRHKYGLITDTSLTRWETEYADNLAGKISGSSPVYTGVSGLFIGFQVKSSGKKGNNNIYKIQIDKKNLMHWISNPFPVYLVGVSIDDGVMFYKQVNSEILAHSKGDKYININIVDKLDSDSMKSIMYCGRLERVLYESYKRSSYVMSSDIEKRHYGLKLCYAIIEDPDIFNLVINSINYMSSLQDEEGIRFALEAISCVIKEYNRSELEMQGYDINAFSRFSKKVNRIVFRNFPEEEIYEVSSKFLVSPERNKVYKIPNDALPGDEDELLELFRVADRIHFNSVVEIIAPYIKGKNDFIGEAVARSLMSGKMKGVQWEPEDIIGFWFNFVIRVNSSKLSSGLQNEMNSLKDLESIFKVASCIMDRKGKIDNFKYKDANILDIPESLDGINRTNRENFLNYNNYNDRINNPGHCPVGTREEYDNFTKLLENIYISIKN